MRAVADPALRRHCDRLAAGEVVAGDRALDVLDADDRAAVDHLAAAGPGAGAEVDDVVGRADGVLVVLDHDDAVAEVAEPAHGADQPLVVALVQADRRLVEDVEHAGQFGADLRGQADALRLAARQGRAAAVQGQVLEPDVEQESQAGAHLLEHAGRHLRLAARQFEAAEEGLRRNRCMGGR